MNNSLEVGPIKHKHHGLGAHAAVLALALLLGGCPFERGNKTEGGDKKAHKGAEAAAAKTPPPPVPVQLGDVVEKEMPLQVSVMGQVQSYATVDVRAQVGGILTKVHFKEGEDVKKGDLLFSIDPRTYEAELKQAEANLERDTAQAKNAQVEATRYTQLAAKQIAPREQAERSQANATALQASLEADRAAIDAAKLKLEFCTIKSPIDGRTGSLMIHEGNLVNASGEGPMITISRVQPIYVVLGIPEQYLGRLRAYMAKQKLKMEVRIPNDDNQEAEVGELTFVDSQIDRATGTIRLKGTFANAKRRLWPGQYVNVRLTLSTARAVVVASQAIQTNQEGSYVFVVGPDQTVQMQPVVVDRAVESESIITSGLQAGQKVVTDGQLRLVPGAKIVNKKDIKQNDQPEQPKQEASSK